MPNKKIGIAYAVSESWVRYEVAATILQRRWSVAVLPPVVIVACAFIVNVTTNNSLWSLGLIVAGYLYFLAYWFFVYRVIGNKVWRELESSTERADFNAVLDKWVKH